ncbi:MAG: 3-deoxy-7-phosphoheptulonate synthase [Elusimicrobiota bacterium]
MSPSSVVVTIICFKNGAKKLAPRVLRSLGVTEDGDHRYRWHAPGVLSVHLEGAVREEALDELRALRGITRVVTIPQARGLVRREEGRPDSTLTLPNGAVVGGKNVAVIAGPCSVESESQVCEIAAMVKEAGAVALRGGAFKPRTSPYSFGGLGERGLECLALAREKTGLPVVTEVIDTEDVHLVSRYADVLQLGSRNMQNFPLLFKAGNNPYGKPILLKRGFGATVDELMQAAEYVLLGRLAAGREGPGVILCERGIRTFETSTRFTLDVGAIPVLKERTHLPVIVDPSHPAGVQRYVPPLARAAVAAGAQGLMVEVHMEPARSWCDKGQALSPGAFAELMDDVRRLAPIGMKMGVVAGPGRRRGEAPLRGRNGAAVGLSSD